MFCEKMTTWIFPEIDLSIPRSHIRPLDCDIFQNTATDPETTYTRCLCLVQEEWLNKLITLNKRNMCFQDAPALSEKSDIEVALLLSQPPVSAAGVGRIRGKDGSEWLFVEMYYVPLLPSAPVQRFPDLLEDDSGDRTEEGYFSRIWEIQGEAQNAAVLRKHPKSLQAMTAPVPQPVTELAGDRVADLCQSVLFCPFLDFSGRTPTVPPTAPPNILRPHFIASMVDHFLVALPFRPFTLVDCLRFSHNLMSCDAAKYFVLYQCMNAVASLQRRGFLAGNVGLMDFAVRNDMWVEMKPVRLFEELMKLVVKEEREEEKEGKRKEDPEDVDVGKISQWTTLWCLGKISNYDYLLALNRAAGRCFGHPDYHPIMPWVVDFTSTVEGYRDLSKSKYRLAKGDHQLDLTYQASDNGMTPHHIPETFSDLTFYIYKARRIPKSVLCQHVRKRWVPAEYPATMERLYRWSCDECIPEFYSDPSIFHSIHPDLPDLCIPSFCSDVPSFLAFHRAALESPYVSANLHHWIDLNFGYKLSGQDAIDAKNVVLSLQTSQKHLKNHGIQQLFGVPHPGRFRTVPWHWRESVPLRVVGGKMKRTVSGDALSVGKEDSGDDVSMDNVEWTGSVDSGELLETFGHLEHLENLERLIDFCHSVDKEPPKLLDDYIPSLKPPDTLLDYLRSDLQALTCLVVEIFASSHTPHYFPTFGTLSKRLAFTKKSFAVVESKVPIELGIAVRSLLSSKVFPYAAEQVLAGYERIVPFPGWMGRWHQYAASVALGADHSILCDVLEDMDDCDRQLVSTFLKQLITHSHESHKWIVLLCDTVLKYYGADKFCDLFLPLIQQLYAEGPPADKSDYAAYVQLFQPEFLQMVAIRLGIGVFLRVWVVPLIEKLADVEEMLKLAGKAGERENGEEEHMFSIECEDQDNESVVSGSIQEPDIVQSHVMDSLTWLAEQIGPVLTSRCISGNLLKSLSLCYAEQEKLQPVPVDSGSNEDTISRDVVAGDIAAWGVSQVLLDIAGLYGPAFIWDHYFSYCAELVKEALRKLTPMNEAGLLGCVEMMQQILPQVTEAALYEHLPFQIINEILYPVVELLTSAVHLFPSGVITRRLLTVKWLNLVYSLAVRIGREAARTMITSPLLVTFFGVFTKLYNTGPTMPTSPVPQGSIPVPARKSPSSDPAPDPQGSPFITIKKDQSSGELWVGTPVTLSLDSFALSPPSVPAYYLNDGEDIQQELTAVFTDQLAADAYIPLCALLGQFHMDEKLINADFLHEMVVGKGQTEGERVRSSRHNSGASVKRSEETEARGVLKRETSVGNTLDVDVIDYEESQAAEAKMLRDGQAGADRALRGNWLAYWQNEIGHDRREEAWNIKQIPLQTFTSHAGAVKCLHVLDSEVSFMSGGKDKTVRIWSIRNTGDGQYASSAEGHYLEHKKPVTELKFLTRERLAASCDGAVNLWDPWTTTTVSRLDVPQQQATCLDTATAPSSVLFVGHVMDEMCYVSRYDVRARGPAAGGQFRVSFGGTAGLIRCLAVGTDNATFACGFSQGVISIFDQRTGMMSATWKAHDSDILQLLPINPTRLLSVGNDNVLCVWDLTREPDERLLHRIPGFSEPIVHCGLVPRGNTADCVALLAGNRLGVVGDVMRGGTTMGMTKIRGDVFKGNCGSLALLPLNRQLLVGGENGTTLLLC